MLIKCKHCGEWLEKGKNNDQTQTNETQSTVHLKNFGSEKNIHKLEKINTILRQGNIFIELPGIPDLSADVPDDYIQIPKGANPANIDEARTYGYMGQRLVRYSNLQFKGWGMYDLVITNNRIVIIPSNIRKKGGLTHVFGFAGVIINQAFDKYQELTKDKKIDLSVINDLCENGLAIYVDKENLMKIIIAEEKIGFSEKLVYGMFSSFSRIIIRGSFRYKNNNINGFVGFINRIDIKDSAKIISKNIDFPITIIKEKVDINSDYRKTL
jgi:hypothetical protein